MSLRPAWSILVCALALFGTACGISAERNDVPTCDRPADCRNGTTCYRGFCVTVLDGGSTPSCDGEHERICDAVCVDVSESRAHCGSCDNPCTDEEWCEEGRCED